MAIYLLRRALNNRCVTFFDKKVSQIKKEENCWTLRTSKDKSVKVKVLVGADGCPSLVRKHVLNLFLHVFCGSAILDSNLGLYERYWQREYSDELRYVAENVLKYYDKLRFVYWLADAFDNLRESLTQ